jgi:uncharacterized protein YutE (UPF0331/DUF86 family)
MSPVDRDLVRRKLQIIVRNLGDLEPIERLSVDEYLMDRMRRKATERLLQESIEAAVDVNMHLARIVGGTIPVDYYGSFLALAELGVADDDLVARLAPAAGLRNRLVHAYDRLDDARVLAAVTAARRDLTSYVAVVEEYISRQAE